MDQSKLMFAQKAQDLSTQLAQVLAQMAELVETWDDRLYGPGAANELTAADITYDTTTNPLGISVTASPNDLYGLVIAASQLGKFVENDPDAVAGPYSATFNRLRRDM